MAFLPLRFKPGINKDLTSFAGEGGWRDGDMIRFREGFPQKLGGWAKYSVTTVLGICRTLWVYATSFPDVILCIGTNKKIYLETGTVLNDITPLRTTLSSAQTDNNMETVNGSTTVIFNLASGIHGAATGDYVTIGGVTGAIGGVPNAEVNINHEVTVIDSNSFSIVVTTAATSTVAAGGGTSITMAFEVSIGYAKAVFGYGWNTDAWSDGKWGEGSNTPVVLPQRDWWFSHIDNDLIISIRKGELYYWVRGSSTDITSVFATRAVTLRSIAASNGFVANNVPIKSTIAFVSQRDQHLIAFGAVPLGSVTLADFDPLLIRWSSQDSPSNWTPKVTNSAGSILLSGGSEIVTALPTRQEILVWTNSNLHTMQFLGTTDVFGVQSYADLISIIGPRAAASANDVTYWMGVDKFYVYDGRVRTLPCTLKEHIFTNINQMQGESVVAGTNEEWNEVWWFYCSYESNFNDRLVVYNYLEGLWYHGTLARSAWVDSSLKDNPLAATGDGDTETGFLYKHESGIDDDGSAITAYITSNDFDLAEGDQMMLTRRIIPDLDFTDSTAGSPAVTFEIGSKNFPGEALTSVAADTQTITETAGGVYTQQVFIRVRGRQVGLTVKSTGVGTHWRLGVPRLDVRPDGRQ
jgi:hypothetical protein